MDRHLLVTVSEQQSALYGVRFVGRFFPDKTGLRLTLFYTAPKPPPLWEGERTYDNVSQSEEQAKQYEIKGRKALEGARKELIQRGFAREAVDAKFQTRKFSKVMDIIQEAEQGLYDAVVLGRRGLSWLEEAFDESVTADLLENKVQFPIWICRRPDTERRNVLVCIDGSEASYRMADHVGFMVGPGTEHRVILFTVEKPGEASEQGAEEILSKGREELVRNGVEKERIEIKAVDGGNVARAILKEAEKGRFAVVGVGRRGAGQGLLKKWFMGSVSSALFKEIQGTALWICH